jgi:hypothetical protein
MGYRDRPSKAHIIWTRETRDGAGTKRFDGERFEKWADHCGFDFETTRRTDHDRADESRRQFQCIFAWGTSNSERIELGDEEWELASQETPQTFIEIDEEGVARLKGWNSETLCDIREMRFEESTLRIRTQSGDTKRVDGEFLSTEER